MKNGKGKIAETQDTEIQKNVKQWRLKKKKQQIQKKKKLDKLVLEKKEKLSYVMDSWIPAFQIITIRKRQKCKIKSCNNY